MWNADLSKEGQLVQIRFAGRVNVNEARACSERIHHLLREAAPELCLLTDLSDLEEMSLECVPVVAEVMDALNKHGIRKVVRIVPRPEQDIGFGIMSLFHYRPDVRTITCASREEAQAHLPA